MKVYDVLEMAGVESLASDPTPAFRGRFYLNTVSGLIKFYTGSAWVSVSTSGTGASVTGTRAIPILITAVGGISPAAAPVVDELQFIAGNLAPITVSANPQIAAGNTVGQKLELVGRDGTNTVLLADGTGLSLNGPWLAEADSVLGLFWDGVNWVERHRG